VANGKSIDLIVIINIISAKLDCHIMYYCNENKTGLNAAPDMIIHLSSIKPTNLKCD